MQHKYSTKQMAVAPVHHTQVAIYTVATSGLLPLGAMLLAGSMSAMAQQVPTAQPPVGADRTLNQVTVKEKAEAPEGKDSVRRLARAPPCASTP